MKHENYEILNLIGYGLAKFDTRFVGCFGFKTKTSFYKYIVQIGICDTVGTVKNRQDIFDPFFDNDRKGWWQRGDVYIHRKIHIDSLFGLLDVYDFAQVVKFHLQEKYSMPIGFIEETSSLTKTKLSPIEKTKYRQLQITGREAELFFMNNFKKSDPFNNGILEDARMFGDGYDFQINVRRDFFLAEIKGLRTGYGSIRMTEKEFTTAKEYQGDYALVVVTNLDKSPQMNVIFNPVDEIDFTEKSINSEQVNYHTSSLTWEMKSI